METFYILRNRNVIFSASQYLTDRKFAGGASGGEIQFAQTNFLGHSGDVWCKSETVSACISAMKQSDKIGLYFMYCKIDEICICH